MIGIERIEVWVERAGVKTSKSNEVATLKDRDCNQQNLVLIFK
jgi:hypothetical protein